MKKKFNIGDLVMYKHDTKKIYGIVHRVSHTKKACKVHWSNTFPWHPASARNFWLNGHDLIVIASVHSGSFDGEI